MILDWSVMNVSIATVAKDVGTDGHRHPDRDHAVHARDGVADDHRREDRRDPRPQARVHDRLRDLRRADRSRPRSRPTSPCCCSAGRSSKASAPRWSCPRSSRWSRRTSHARGPPARYGLVAAGGAIAVAAGPAHRRVLHHVLVVAATCSRARCSSSACILLLNRRMADMPTPRTRPRLDLVGTALSALGLGLDRLRGPARRRRGASCSRSRMRPTWLGLSPVIWLILGGGVVVLAVPRVGATRRSTPVARRSSTPRSSAIRRLRSGLTAFFFQYLLQAGLFFAVPLFLSVALGLSRDRHRAPHPAALDHARARRGRHPQGVPERVAAARRPARVPRAVRRPRRVGRRARRGRRRRDRDARPMLLAGLGIGALASQLGAVTVSSVPDEQSGEVGGLQNTFTNLGRSIGTALAGAVLISALTALVLHRHREQPGGARRPHVEGADRAHERRPVHLRRRPRSRARRRRRRARRPPPRSSTRTRRPHSTRCARRSRCWRCSRWSRCSSAGDFPSNPRPPPWKRPSP